MMMLTPATQLEDTTLRIYCWMRGYVAYDPETKTYLGKSYGRHKAGRKTRYYLSRESDYEPAKRIYAWDDAEAYAKAQDILSKS